MKSINEFNTLVISLKKTGRLARGMMKLNHIEYLRKRAMERNMELPDFVKAFKK